MFWFLVFAGLLAVLGLYGRQLGSNIAEFGRGVQTGISSILSPQVRPTVLFRFGWWVGPVSDYTKEPSNGTDDRTNPDRLSNVSLTPAQKKFLSRWIDVE